MTIHTGTVGMEPAGTRAHRHLIAVTLEVRLEIFCHEPSAVVLWNGDSSLRDCYKMDREN